MNLTEFLAANGIHPSNIKQIKVDTEQSLYRLAFYDLYGLPLDDQAEIAWYHLSQAYYCQLVIIPPVRQSETGIAGVLVGAPIPSLIVAKLPDSRA